MAISDDQKLDYLWKKLGYGVSKTDVNGSKSAVNESISSPLLLRGDRIWREADSIPAAIPGSSTSVVAVYPTSAPNETTADNTATANRTWKTGLTDWIPPEIGSSYQVKVYLHTSGDAGNAASSGTQLFAAGSGNNDEWFFDYQSGILNFIGTNLPSGASFSGKSIYISGARYTGLFGISASNNDAVLNNTTLTGNTTISTLILSNVLGTEYGGTGLSSFNPNGVLFAANSSVLTQASGVVGQILQISADGTPTFDNLDGGDF
jgi:hypothetical protein